MPSNRGGKVSDGRKLTIAVPPVTPDEKGPSQTVKLKDIRDRVFVVTAKMDGEKAVIKIEQKEVPQDKIFDEMKQRPINNEFQPFDAFKAWNSMFAGDPCKHRFLKLAPGQLYLYDPPDGQPTPPYRFPPNSTFPDRLVTNQMGWRGPPIEVPRGPRTIRIVFVGSSTTMGAPHSSAASQHSCGVMRRLRIASG